MNIFKLLDRLTEQHRAVIEKGDEPVIVRFRGGPSVCLKCRLMIGNADRCPDCDPS